MNRSGILIAAALVFLPVNASAQALMFGNAAASEAYANGRYGLSAPAITNSSQTNFRFSATDPNDLFLPEEYRDRGGGYELRSGFETALSKTLDGIIEYRWNNGEDPALAIAGVPAEVKVRKSSVMLGLSYRH